MIRVVRRLVAHRFVGQRLTERFVVGGTGAPLLAVLLVLGGFGAATPLASTPVRDEPTLAVVAVQSLRATEVRVVGRVVAKHTALIGARVAGRIEAFGNDDRGQPLDVGSRVEAGDELFHLERRAHEAAVAVARASQARAEAALHDLRAGTRPERIAAAAAVVADVTARLKEANNDLERFRRLVLEDKTAAPKRLEESETRVLVLEAERAGAEATLAEAKAGATPSSLALAEAVVEEAAASTRLALVDLEDTVVRAPFSGLVKARNRGVGDYVTPAPFIEVLELVSANDLEISASVVEHEFGRIAEGVTEVLVESDLLAAPLTLRVDRRVGAIDPNTGSFEIRSIVPPEFADRLAPGAFVRLSVRVQGKDGGVVIPIGAVFLDGGDAYVFVARDGRMRRTPVTLGDRLSEGYVIRSGLVATDSVVVGPRVALEDDRPLPAIHRP